MSYADSLRQQARWIREALDPDFDPLMKITLDDIDVDKLEAAADEIERIQTENWQLRQACGYPIPADKETPQNPFKCGICDARALPPSHCANADVGGSKG